MSEYEVKIGVTFKSDIKRIVAYYAVNEYDSKIMKKILEGIYQDLKYLGVSPHIGSRLDNKVHMNTHYRYLVSNQYLIFYKVFDKDKVVQVYHVYNCKENYLKKIFFD